MRRDEVLAAINEVRSAPVAPHDRPGVLLGMDLLVGVLGLDKLDAIEDRMAATSGAAETSKAAAERVLPKSGTVARHVVEILNHRPDGLTDREILNVFHTSSDPRFGKVAESTPRKRRGELVEAGWVEHTGYERNDMMIWRLTPEARRQAGNLHEPLDPSNGTSIDGSGAVRFGIDDDTPDNVLEFPGMTVTINGGWKFFGTTEGVLVECNRCDAKFGPVPFNDETIQPILDNHDALHESGAIPTSFVPDEPWSFPLRDGRFTLTVEDDRGGFFKCNGCSAMFGPIPEWLGDRSVREFMDDHDDLHYPRLPRVFRSRGWGADHYTRYVYTHVRFGTDWTSRKLAVTTRALCGKFDPGYTHDLSGDLCRACEKIQRRENYRIGSQAEVRKAFGEAGLETAAGGDLK